MDLPRWLAIRLELLGNSMVLAAALFAVLARGSIRPATTGLSLSYALSVTQSLTWMVRVTSDLENNVVAVERIREYSETLQVCIRHMSLWSRFASSGLVLYEHNSNTVDVLSLDDDPDPISANRKPLQHAYPTATYPTTGLSMAPLIFKTYRMATNTFHF